MKKLGLVFVAATTLLVSANSYAIGSSCKVLADALGVDRSWVALHGNLEVALKDAQSHVDGNGGLGFNMWGTLIGADGKVCAIAKTGAKLNDQWTGSRVISAQKANTAVLFSTNAFALSTANLMAPTQPGGSLYGLQFSNPVDTKSAYRGNAALYGTKKDSLRNKKVGGVNIFGGGLALYKVTGSLEAPKYALVGGLGVSGDTSCADHNIAWRTREALGATAGAVAVVNVPNEPGTDAMIYAVSVANLDGFEHVDCGGSEQSIAIGTLGSGVVGD